MRNAGPIALAVLALAAVPLGAPLRADDDGRAIIEKMVERQTAADEQGTMTWTIIARDGAEKRRRLVYRVKRGEAGRQLMLLRFLEPPEVRRTALLSLSGGEKPDAQWVYLPDQRSTKRVAPGHGGERFLGSDFAYEDFTAEDVAGNAYRVLGCEGIGGEACDLVEATPRPERARGRAAYGRRILAVRVKDRFPVRTRFFAPDGTPLKTLEAQEVVEVGGFARADRLEMRDEAGASRTIVTVEGRKINAGIADRVFSERELEEGE